MKTQYKHKDIILHVVWIKHCLCCWIISHDRKNNFKKLNCFFDNNNLYLAMKPCRQKLQNISTRPIKLVKLKNVKVYVQSA